METMFLKKGAGSRHPGDSPTVIAVERAIMLLKKLSESRGPVGVRELAREVGYSASTTQKLLNSLAAYGLVEQDGKTQRYRLGLELFGLGAAALHQRDIHEVAYPALKRLTAETEESSYLALLTPDRLRCVFIAKVECSHLLRWTADLGDWRPLNCTADGKAILACLPEEHLHHLREQGALYRLTPRSIMDLDELKQELTLVHERGYAYSNEEFAEGVRSLAAPIFDHTGAVKGSVSIAGPKIRMTDGRIPALGEAVHRAGRMISQSLGFDVEKGFYGRNRSKL